MISAEWIASVAEKQLFLRSVCARLDGWDQIRIEIFTVDPAFMERNNRMRRFAEESSSRRGTATEEDRLRAIGPELPWRICRFVYQDSYRRGSGHKREKPQRYLQRLIWEGDAWWGPARATIVEWRSQYSEQWGHTDAVVCVGDSGNRGGLNLMVLQHLIRMQEAFSARMEQRGADDPFWDLTSDRIDGLLTEIFRGLRSVGQLMGAVADIPVI